MARRKSKSAAERNSAVEMTPDVHQRIAEAAYLRAERRGFRGGDPVDDWLSAEREILTPPHQGKMD